MWRERGWRAAPWSDQGLGKGRGRALVSQDFCCGLALPLSLAARASEDHQKHQSENRCKNSFKINCLELTTAQYT